MKVYVLETIRYDEIPEETDQWEFQGVYLVKEMAEADGETSGASDWAVSEYEVICPS